MVEGPAIATQLFDSVAKWIIPLIVLFLVILVLQWLRSLKERGGTEIRVYRRP